MTFFVSNGIIVHIKEENLSAPYYLLASNMDCKYPYQLGEASSKTFEPTRFDYLGREGVDHIYLHNTELIKLFKVADDVVRHMKGGE